MRQLSDAVLPESESETSYAQSANSPLQENAPLQEDAPLSPQTTRCSPRSPELLAVQVARALAVSQTKTRLLFEVRQFGDQILHEHAATLIARRHPSNGLVYQAGERLIFVLTSLTKDDV